MGRDCLVVSKQTVAPLYLERLVSGILADVRIAPSPRLDHELRPFGIRVVVVEPAYTRTSFEENLAKPDQLLEIYDSARAGMNAILRKALETGDAPEVVARTVLKAATDSVPKGRYTAGKMARQISFLRRFVPASAFDKSLRKQNGLPL